MNAKAVEYPDLLRVPVLGRVLRWKYGRLVFQLPMTLIALLLIYDGFTGRPIASQNLATIAPWVHYRGLIIVALLLAGNLFCMGCPFTLPRTLAKRLSLRGGRFPRLFRNKWLAIGNLFFLFFLYEWFDLWSSPWLTAWVIIAYFVGAFVLEAVFSESAFCKYVCPLGTFNFVYSTVSPLQITARDGDICRTCVGKECLNGSYATQPVILIDAIGVDGQPTQTHTHDQNGVLGCGTELFVPQIKSNLDCTLCLDCARACPHQNVALAIRPPGSELVRENAWAKRWDLALLVICLAFMGVVNAFGMIPPVYALMQSIATSLGLTGLGWDDHTIEGIVLFLVFAIGSLALPISLTLGAAWITRQITRTKLSLREIVGNIAPAFVPIGFGIWGAHYGFHFITGFFGIIPVVHQFLLDHGITLFGLTPDWALGGSPNETVIGLVQLVMISGGALGSLIVLQRIARRLYGRRMVEGMITWALILLALTLMIVWIFSYPMEMRGSILFD